MKNVLLIAFAFFTLTNCKKQSDANDTTSSSSTPPDVTGTWSFTSNFTKMGGNTSLMSSTDYPCTANHKLILDENGTAVMTYTGSDTCYIVQTTTMSQYWGVPNSDSLTYTWRRDGNTVYLLPTTSPAGKEKVVQYTVVNAKPQLVYKDTTASMNRIQTYTYSR